MDGDSATEEVVVDTVSKSTSNHYDSKDDFSKMHAGSRDVLTSTSSNTLKPKKFSKIKRRIAYALLLKNIQQFCRHPGGFIFSLIFPIIQLVSFFVAVGHDPREVVVAIANGEMSSWQECADYKNKTVIYEPEDYSCKFHKLSCRYIESLNDTLVTKTFYSTLEEAKDAVRAGKALAALYIPSNFSESNVERQELGTSTPDGSIDNSIAYYWMDMSNHQLAYFLQTRLYKDYVKFAKQVFIDCNTSPRLADIPIAFEDPIYGTRTMSFAQFMVPGVMLTILFFMATTVTSTLIIMDRLEGVWDRTIVAGVESGEILAVHVVLQTFVIVLQTIEIMLLTFIGYEIPYIGDIMNMTILLFLQGMAGMCFGFLISVICDTYTLAFFVSTGSFYPMIMLCGIMWPMEGMAEGVRYFSMGLPFTLPIQAMRSIIEKGYTMSNDIVYQGYLVTLTWIVSLLFICYILLQGRRK